KDRRDWSSRRGCPPRRGGTRRDDHPEQRRPEWTARRGPWPQIAAGPRARCLHPSRLVSTRGGLFGATASSAVAAPAAGGHRRRLGEEGLVEPVEDDL